MANKCQYIPKTKDKEGRWVDSELYKALLSNFSRDQTTNIYHGIFSDYFLDWFNWLNPNEKTSLAVDANGQPLIFKRILGKGETEDFIFLNTRNQEVIDRAIANDGKIESENLAPNSYKSLLLDVSLPKQEQVHEDETIQAAMLEYPGQITAINNPHVWKIEERYGLLIPGNPWRTDIYGNPYRRKQPFSHAKARRLKSAIEKEGFGVYLQPVKGTGIQKYVVIPSKIVSQKDLAFDRFNAIRDEYIAVREKYGERFPIWDAAEKQKGESTRLLAIHKQAREALDARLAVMEKRYNFIARADFEDFYDEFLSQNNTTEAISSMVVYATRVTNQLHNRFLDFKRKNEPFTPQVLQTWSDFLIAYDALDELQKLLVEDPSVINDPDIVRVLDDTIKKKNSLKDMYRTKGVEILAKWLAPYYNGIRRGKEKEYRKAYRTQYRNKKKGREYNKEIGDLSEDEYVEKQINYADTLDKIKEETEILLRDELREASRDIGYLSRWLDNMLDTADPVAAAVVEAFVQADEKSRLEAIKKRTEMLKELREFEKSVKRPAGMSDERMYKDILELDHNGILTQYLVMPWKSSLMEAEHIQRRKIYKEGLIEDEPEYNDIVYALKHGNIDKKEYRARIRKLSGALMGDWVKKEIRIYEDQFSGALKKQLKFWRDNIDPETGEAYITKTDYLNLFNNEEWNHFSPRRLVEDETISETVGELVIRWKEENRWKYSNVQNRWRNPQWDALMKKIGIKTDIPYYQQYQLLQKSDDPTAKFYRYIVSVAQEADSKVPYSYRLGYRLPGVPKVFTERMKTGEGPASTIASTFKMGVFKRQEDIDRGEEILTDEQGRPKFFLPIHYVNKIELKNQSFDLASVYFKWWESTNDYLIKRKILPEIEMAKYFISMRRAKKRDSLGRLITSKLKGNVNIDDFDEEKDKPSKVVKTHLAEQFNDWFEMAVYGKKAKEGSLYNIKLFGNDMVLDGAKLADSINRYTSLSLLALNLVQGAANVLIGETMQKIDAVAKEHVSVKSLTKATIKYDRWMLGMTGDIGARAPTHVGSLLMEWANVLHQSPSDVVWSKRTKVGQLLDTSTAFSLQRLGEHWMQGRYLFARLIEKQAYDKDGNHLGNMLDQYYAKDGDLVLNKKVSLEKSEWTLKDQGRFRRATKGQLSRMHGEYSDLGRVALQRSAIGRMTYMFRKFIVPGVKRRYGRLHYIQRLDQFVEGNYRTTFKFLNNIKYDLIRLKWTLIGDEWATLDDHERANIVRMLGEVSALVSTWILASFAYRKIHEDDDDESDLWWEYMAYQAYRLKAELLFFSPDITETMSILRSPMASMSVIENIIRLIGHITSPGERYERGPWKGQLKLNRTLVNFVPMWKQYYKMRDVGELISWFKN